MTHKNLASETISWIAWKRNFSFSHGTAGSHRSREGFYRFITRSFHHLIFYRMEADQPVIYAVLDGRRDPAFNQQKLHRF